MSETIGERYELLEKLGTGGMATVWKAMDRALNRPVAIKRLLPHLASDPLIAERFRNEAVSVAGLSHPGIVSVYDTGVDEDGPYMVLELVPGDTLAMRLATDGALPLATVAVIVAQVAGALDYAHQQGIVHRDIKPANLIVDGDGKAHLTDFGIARSLSDTASITRPGELAGTLLYIAPEIVDGGRATPASDIYSLAAMTVEMLTGEPPYQAESVGGLLATIREGDTATFTGGLPDDVVPTITAAMSTDPAIRPTTAGSFASSLLTNTTIVMPLSEVPGIAAAAPVVSASTPQTRPMVKPAPGRRSSTGKSEAVRKSGPRDRRPKAVPIVIGMILLGAAIVTAAALSGDSPPVSNLDTTTTSVSDEATTSASTSTSTSTTTSTTLAPAPTPESVASEISTHLSELQPPDFKPKDVKRVRDRLDDLMRAWNEGNEGLRDRFKKIFDAIGDLEESPQHEHLLEHARQLADLMGVDLDADD